MAIPEFSDAAHLPWHLEVSHGTTVVGDPRTHQHLGGAINTCIKVNPKPPNYVDDFKVSTQKNVCECILVCVFGYIFQPRISWYRSKLSKSSQIIVYII